MHFFFSLSRKNILCNIYTHQHSDGFTGEQTGVQNLVQGYFGMQTEQLGIQLPTFQLVDDLLCCLSYHHPKVQGNPAITF